MELVPGERILWQGRPSWRAHLGYFLAWIPLAIIPVAVAGGVRAAGGDTGLPYWQWLLVTLVLLVAVVAVDAVRRQAVFYAVTTQRLRVRRGILSRTEQTARFDRVQNVTVAQSLLDRILRVGAVDFDTAGAGEGDDDLVFRGISHPQRLVAVVARNIGPAEGVPTAGL